jgi:Amt family ammonium transporter
MPEYSSLFSALAFLVPLGYALIAVAGLPEERARHAALSMLAALGLAVVGYVATGFALEYGGVGLVRNLPGAEGLIWEWSAIGETWGAGWGMAGLAGWGLTGPADTTGAYTLALASLPWVMTAALIPLVALRGAAPAWGSALAGLLVGAILYPLAGNWIWGGGWLAGLGQNLGLGHGFIDFGGAGLVHLLGAATACAGIAVFLRRKPRAARTDEPVPLPPVHLPLLGVTGAMLLLAGLPAWLFGNPLVALEELDPARTILNVVLIVATGAMLPLLYTWFVSGSADPLMAVRGVAAASVVALATAPFVAPLSALLLGAATGLFTPLAIYFSDRVLRLSDPAAVLILHGLAGVAGLLALGLFADGAAGQGWNAVSGGVTGILAASGSQAGPSGQLKAQAIGVAALALLGFFGAWICLAPLAFLARLLRSATQEPGIPATQYELPPYDAAQSSEDGRPSTETVEDSTIQLAAGES